MSIRCYFWCIFVGALTEYCYGGTNYTTNDDLCKSSLDVCLKNVSNLLDHTKMSGIPKSKDDVDIVCKGFKMGMKCLDEFSNLCLSSDEKNLISDNVIGARYTFKFLCDDEAFQKDYLKYTDCYRAINSDWDACADRFMSLVREEMNVNRSEDAKLFDLCCIRKNVVYADPLINLQDLKYKIRLACSNLRREQINAATSTELLKRLESCLEHQGGNFEQFISAKHGFLNCVYSTSKIKCGKEEAIFIKKIAATLSENKLVSSACRHIKLGHCNMGQQISYSIYTIVLNVFLVVWCYKIIQT